MRTRTDTDIHNQSYSQTLVAYDGTGTSSTSFTRQPVTRSWRMDDLVTPGFRRAQSMGEFTFNPMESANSMLGDDTDYVADFQLQYRAYTWSEWITYGGFRNGITPMDGFVLLGNYTPLSERVHSANTDPTTRNDFHYSEVESVKSETLSRLHAQMSSSDFMSVVSAAESQETLAMLTKTAAFMGRASASLARHPVATLNYLRKASVAEIRKLGHMSGVKSALGHAANAWLQARYGWMALYYDWRAFSGADPKMRELRRLTVSGSQYYIGSPVTTSVPYDNVVGTESHRVTVTTESKQRTRYSNVSCGAMYRMNPSFASIDAFGARRVFSSAWELIPFSFVVDWIINVSDKIAAIDTAVLCDVVGTWRTTRHSLSWTHSLSEILDNDNTSTWRVLGVYRKATTRTDYCTHIIREANPSNVVLPQVSVNLTTARAVDALALLRVNSKKLLALLRG